MAQQLTLAVFLEASLCDLGMPLVTGCWTKDSR